MQLLRGAQPGRPHLVDLNLVPPGYRPRALPLTGAGLGLLAAVGVFVFLAIFQFKVASDSEVNHLQNDLFEAQNRLAELNTASQVGSFPDKNRIGWSRVLQTIIASLPADVRLQDVRFSAETSAGPQAIVKGEAAEYPAIVEFADNLRSSPFFARVSIQSMSQQSAPSSSAAVVVTPTATSKASASLPLLPATPTPTAFAAFPLPPSLLPSPSNTRPALPTAHLSQPSPTPTATPRSFLPLPPLVITPTITSPVGATGTPTAVPTTSLFPGTPLPRASATPTPNLAGDFIVATKTETCDMSLPADSSGYFINGQVQDVDGSPMAGIGVRVQSIYTTAPWSADTTTAPDGRFRFWLTKGNFSARVTAGSSELANELWTLSTSQQGACSWEVTFKKNNTRTPVAVPTTTGTITPTPTTTGTTTPSPTITPTPATGTPIAGTPIASNNSSSAGLAIDGSDSTVWNAGAPPYQYWQQSFSTTYYINGINLVVSQNPSGNTTHVVRFYDASNVELVSSAVTFSGYTFEGQVLTRSFYPALSGVKSIRVETTNGPSWVAWKEIQVLAGSGPTPTPTATPTALREPDDTWTQAKPIAINETQQRSFYRADDVDWAMFYTGSTSTGPHNIRAYGASGVHPDLTVYEGTGEQTGYRYYTSVDSALPDGSRCATASSIEVSLVLSTTYFVQLTNLSAGTGSYTIKVSPTPPDDTTCSSSLAASHSPTLPSYDVATNPFTAIAGSPASRPSGLAAPGPGLLSFLNEGTALASTGVAQFTIVLDIRSEGPP